MSCIISLKKETLLNVKQRCYKNLKTNKEIQIQLPGHQSHTKTPSLKHANMDDNHYHQEASK